MPTAHPAIAGMIVPTSLRRPSPRLPRLSRPRMANTSPDSRPERAPIPAPISNPASGRDFMTRMPPTIPAVTGTANQAQAAGLNGPLEGKAPSTGNAGTIPRCVPSGETKVSVPRANPGPTVHAVPHSAMVGNQASCSRTRQTPPHPVAPICWCRWTTLLACTSRATASAADPPARQMATVDPTAFGSPRAQRGKPPNRLTRAPRLAPTRPEHSPMRRAPTMAVTQWDVPAAAVMMIAARSSMVVWRAIASPTCRRGGCPPWRCHRTRVP